MPRKEISSSNSSKTIVVTKTHEGPGLGSVIVKGPISGVVVLVALTTGGPE